MVLKTEPLNVPQDNNSQCIYTTVLYSDRKLLPSVEASEVERKKREARLK